jgi:segregation and condensation protein B
MSAKRNQPAASRAGKLLESAELPLKPPAGDANAGLSLDQLSAAFAEMLGSGDDPYAPAPPLDDDEPLPPDMASEQQSAARESQVDACEITPRSILEALLFVGSPDNAPLTSAQIAALMRGVRPSELDAYVRELNTLYEARRAPYYIAPEGAGYRLRLREEFSRIRNKFYGRVRRARLSQAAIEVLSLVAYNEPLGLDDINRLRGTSSGPILGQLVRRQLLQLARTGEKRRGVYSTTPRFLELFGLHSLADLPRSQDLDPP